MELHLTRSSLRRLVRSPSLGAVAGLSADLRWCARSHGRLLVVGTPTFEPWHLVAHLQTSAFAESGPTLVRFSAPTLAPAHLSIGLSRLGEVSGRDSVLVVAPDDTGSDLLERLADARRRGGRVLALARTADANATADLSEVSHNSAFVDSQHIDLAQHLLPVAAA